MSGDMSLYTRLNVESLDKFKHGSYSNIRSPPIRDQLGSLPAANQKKRAPDRMPCLLLKRKKSISRRKPNSRNQARWGMPTHRARSEIAKAGFVIGVAPHRPFFICFFLSFSQKQQRKIYKSAQKCPLCS